MALSFPHHACADRSGRSSCFLVLNLMLMGHTIGCGLDLASELSGVLSEELQTLIRIASLSPEEQACAPRPNRCGPGLFSLAIPDCPLGVVCFISACNRHDICYETCGALRRDCDDAFFQDLTLTCAINSAQGDEAFTQCMGLAYIYWQAVVRFGQIPFEKFQDRVCKCSPTGLDFITSVKRPMIFSKPATSPFEDRDDDLMPDAWETAVGLDPTDPADAVTDPDADGSVNLLEYLHHTDPFVPEF